MIVTKTIMNADQKAFMEEIEAKIKPVQDELDSLQAELQALMQPVLAVKEKMRAGRAKMLPLGLLKSGLVTPRARAKYFPEFYGMTASDVKEDTIEGQSAIAQIGIIKDTDDQIKKFIESVRPLLAKSG